MFGFNQGGAGVYAQMGVETGVLAASPNKLTIMLYEGAIAACKSAITHIKNGEIEQKGAMLSKAALIVESGLRASLDKQSGGEIAASLDGLYLYMVRKLLQANIRQQVEPVQEVIVLLTNLKSAWEAIDSQKAPSANATQTANPVSNIPQQLSGMLNRNVAMYAGA